MSATGSDILGLDAIRKTATYCVGSNMFFSSRQAVGRGEAGPSTPCSMARACTAGERVGPVWGGGPGRGPEFCMGRLTWGANSAGAPAAPASLFIKAARAVEFMRMPPPSSAPDKLSDHRFCHLILVLRAKLGSTLTLSVEFGQVFLPAQRLQTQFVP